MRIGNLGQPGQQASRQRGREIEAVGSPPWTDSDIRASMEEVLALQPRLPIPSNQGGMSTAGLTALWTVLRKVNPSLVIESGVWKGQTTWIIEQALPGADVICIDPDLGRLGYRSPRAQYTTADFLTLDLARTAGVHSRTLAFFDDHQDVFPRLNRCLELGIKDLLLDDNYPEYSGNRHISVAAILNQEDGPGNPRYPEERRYVLEHAESYHIFPPMFDYGHPVTGEKSPITQPSFLGPFDPAAHARYRRFNEDMSTYRWTTYLRLK